MATRAPLPSGTVTLLFTDIEGSTQHWEERPDAMASALRRHDQLLRAEIARHGGHVFKTIGDAFCAAFARASDAVAAAEAAQRAIAAHDWSAIGDLQVRMALHSGTTDERDGDYFGPALNRVSRLLSIAHGGQTVASGATAQLLRGLLPPQTGFRDLGEHRLKDLIEPEHVWQLVAPGLRDRFPPLASLGSLPNNLPRQLSALVGRDDALAEVESLVREQPLVTLVGTGGIGKTRLALQVGADLLDAEADGAWFVELAPVTDPAMILNTIASTFGLREQPNRPLLDVVTRYLRPRRLLLILDNCEHLVEEVANVAAAILRAAPHVRLLATSREPLRIGGEHVYRVPSLAVPPDGALTSEEALQYGAIALFAARARASDSRFALTDEIAPIVADICRRLDGIALAIELAAARVRMLPPRRLAQKLDERFRVLTGGNRTALPRQQTMRALIDWSHDLLTEPEQRLFRRLSIFVGGCSLEAAESVCPDDTLDALDVVDLLSSLVDKSLVVAEVDSSRYRLLESTRAFALEKLEHSGESESVARRHARWAADLGDRPYAALWTLPMSQWRVEFAPEFENVRAAIDWALAHGDIVLAARILAGFSGSYRRLVGEAELIGRLDPVIAGLDSDEHTALAARAWHALSVSTMGQRSIDSALRAIELGERSSDAPITTRSLAQLAGRLFQSGRAEEAQPVIDRALRLSKEGGLTRSAIHAEVLNVMASIARAGGRFDEAREVRAEALALATALGDESMATIIRLNMAEYEFGNGNTAAALELVKAVEGDALGPHGSFYKIVALVNGAAYAIMLNDIAEARAAAQGGVRLARGVLVLYFAICMQHLATVAVLSGDVRRGALLLGFTETLYREIGYEREATERRTYEMTMTALRERLTEQEIEALGAEGAALSEDRAVAEAMAV